MTTITTQEQAALTSAEQQLLQQHERTIKRGLQTFYAVGQALVSIREQRLYRVTHSTFETYCAERWGISDRHARRLMDAGQVVAQIEQTGPIGPVPTNEAQTRPLSKLPPEEQPEAWQEAVERSGGKPTARHVEQVVQERTKPAAPEPEEPTAPRPSLPPGWYFQDSSNPADIIAINRENASQASGFCQTHEEAAARAWEVHQGSQQPAPEEEPEFDPSPVSVALDDQFEEPYPPLPAARIIDMSEERREAMMAELETLGYDVKYNKGCVSNKRKGAPGHMNENLYYVEEFENRLQIARQNFEREQEQQAERERMRAEIARQREEYQSWPEQVPVCGQTIIQCMIDAHRLLQAGEAQQAKVQAQRFRAHPDVASLIGSAITGMQRAMEGSDG